MGDRVDGSETCLDYASPCGPIGPLGREGRLFRVVLGEGGGDRRNDDALMPFAGMLDAYFGGAGIECDPSDLATEDLGAFQKLVRRELLRVEFGEVVTYGELARQCGRPGAARAIGGAMAANTLPIFVPCHRVVAAGGGLGGFGAGLDWKVRLLKHEVGTPPVGEGAPKVGSWRT